MAIPQVSIIDIIQSKRKNYSFKTENKSCYVLTCRIEGESLFFYNQKEQLVQKGDILYIPANSCYSQRCNHETIVCFHLIISGPVLSEMKLFSPEDREKICELFLRAERLWREKPERYEYICMAILYEIMAQIDICKEEQLPLSKELLRPAMIYLDAHLYDADLSLEQVCKAAHISRTYFNRLFSKAYGCTPTVYINQQRIKRAKQLLISGSFSNEEIANMCGFNDVKYFYVVFKKRTGQTTSDYKATEQPHG